MLVQEDALDAFREAHLSPQAILDEVERSVEVLYRLGIGVGKSVAADRLLAFPGTYARFDLVVYAAPSWAILHERAIVAGRDVAPVQWLLLRPRPVDDCGQYADEWERLEKRGCSAYGKGTLCRACQDGVPKPQRCFWPKQFSNLKGLGLIFTTEQQLVLNRSLVWMLKTRTRAGRVLVVLDEARLLDANFEVCLNPPELGHFCEILREPGRPRGIQRWLADTWSRGIEFLLDATSAELADTRFEFPSGLNRRAFLIQSEGVRRFGTSFRYLGYDLANLPWGPRGERWKDSAGVIHFTARPYLNCHLLILSAHLSAPYTAHRLGRSSIVSPFEETRFQHTGTRVVNLRNRIGADSYFKRNHKQILDVFAVLIVRNVVERRSTLLISRKKSKAFCAAYLKSRLSGWDVEVDFVTEGYDSLPPSPDPRVIPILHYGVLGVNNFTEYQSAYCLNSYYVSSGELNRHVQDAEPEQFRVRLKIVSGPEMTRRVEIEDRGVPDLDHTALGNIYLRKLEVDPVLQAAGRVRFLTQPREVVFFQMHDLAREVGECEDARTLAGLREALRTPSAKEVDEFVDSRRAQNLLAEGLTAAEVAGRLGLSRRTLFRRCRAQRSAKNTTSTTSCRLFGTLGAGSGEGVATP